MRALRIIRQIMVASALLASCSLVHRENRVLEPQEFIPLYGDLSRAAFASKKVGLDSAATAQRLDSIMATHGVTRNQVTKTLEWYNADVRRWKPFFDSLLVGLEDDSRRETGG